MKLDIENTRYGYASIVITVDGVMDVLAKSISYSDSMDRGMIEGNSRMSLGMSQGQYKAEEGSIELYVDDFQAVVKGSGNAAKGFYDRAFLVSVSYGEGTTMVMDELIGCRWTKRDSQNQSGPDALTRTLSFMPLYIRWNKVDPLSNMPTGAK